MLPAPSSRFQSLARQTAVPVRSPRTSIILAELARQRRLERRQRRLKRQRRRRVWDQLQAWLARLGRWPGETATAGTLARVASSSGALSRTCQSA